MESVTEALRKARKAKGFSLEEVFQETNIHKKYLKALEEGDYDVFPGESYAKGFLRNYGNFLGLNGEELVKKYVLQKKPSPIVPPEGKKKSKRKNRKLLYNLLAGAIIVLLIYLIWLNYDSISQYRSLEEGEREASSVTTPLGEDNEEEVREKEKREEREEPEGEISPVASLPREDEGDGEREEEKQEGKDEVKTEIVPLSSLPREDEEDGEREEEKEEGRDEKVFLFERLEYEEKKLFLKGVALEETWVQVIADGKKLEEGMLAIGEEKIWKAAAEIKIKIGNVLFAIGSFCVA